MSWGQDREKVQQKNTTSYHIQAFSVTMDELEALTGRATGQCHTQDVLLRHNMVTGKHVHASWVNGTQQGGNHLIDLHVAEVLHHEYTGEATGGRRLSGQYHASTK